METSLIPSLNQTAIVSVAESPADAYTLPDIGPARPVRILVNDNPLRPEDHATFEIEPFQNESIDAILFRANIRDESGNCLRIEDYKCSLNGELVLEDELSSEPVEPGDEIVLYPRAAGGKVWQMVSMVALMVGAAYLTPFLSLFLAPWLAASITGVAVASGSMLISWAFSPGQPSSPAWSASYDPTGPKGLAEAGTPVPKGGGTFGWCGNVISSYVSFDGKDGYINCLVCYGWGLAKSISNILINKQPI